MSTLPGDKHLTASVYIFSTESPPRVLLVHHKKMGRWVQPGGHVERDENPYEAAVREAREETGIDVAPFLPAPEILNDGNKKLPVPNFLSEYDIPAYGAEPAHKHVDVIYVARVPFQEPALAAAEHTAVRWFTRAELAVVPMFKNFRALMEDLLK